MAGVPRGGDGLRRWREPERCDGGGPHRPRAGAATPRRPRLQQRGYQLPSVPEHADGRTPPVQHLRQARADGEVGPGGSSGPAARPRTTLHTRLTGTQKAGSCVVPATVGSAARPELAAIADAPVRTADLA